MEIMFKKALHIEDRRRETSRDKPSIIVTDVCPDCGKKFAYLTVANETANYSPLCKLCRESRPALLIHMYDENGGYIDNYTTSCRGKAHAEEKLRRKAKKCHVGGALMIDKVNGRSIPWKLANGEIEELDEGENPFPR